MHRNPTPFDILIHGHGLVALVLALALAKQAFRVGLIGSAVSVHPPSGEYHDVRAFALGAAAKGLLERVDAWPTEAAVTAVTRMQIWGDAGGALILVGRHVFDGWHRDLQRAATRFFAALAAEQGIAKGLFLHH